VYSLSGTHGACTGYSLSGTHLEVVVDGKGLVVVVVVVVDSVVSVGCGTVVSMHWVDDVVVMVDVAVVVADVVLGKDKEGEASSFPEENRGRKKSERIHNGGWRSIRLAAKRIQSEHGTRVEVSIFWRRYHSKNTGTRTSRDTLVSRDKKEINPHFSVSGVSTISVRNH